MKTTRFVPYNLKRAAVALATMALVVIGCATDGKQAPHVEVGRKYADAGEWDKSVNELQKAFELAPDDKEVRLLLERARFEASLAHMALGERYLAQELFLEAVAEFQIAMAMNPSNLRAARLQKQTQDMQDARHLYKQGVNYEKTNKFAKAKTAFIKASKLDPNYEPARAAIERYKGKETRVQKYRIDLKSDTPISFKFKKTPIINVFEVLTQLTGVNFIFDKEMPESKVTMFMTDVSFDRFIDVLLKTNDLASLMVDGNTMIIYPNTPGKIKEYEDLQIRTFYLSNLEAKRAVALLSKILKSRDIIANESLNAIVIRGSSEVIQIAERLIEANDGPPAEVLLNVEFLEVTRTLEENLGLTITEFIDIGVGEAAGSISSETEFAANASLYALGRISSKEIILSVPTATVNLLKQDGDTRILAQPKIRVKNAENASILLGERVPLRVNRRVDSNTGDITSDFQYTDVGVRLQTTPVINIHDEVTLNLDIEVSALGENLGTADDPQFPIRTRNAVSVISLRDGETVILGGLINDAERDSYRKIPGLGDIPSVGRLFSNRETSDIKTDVIMIITPYVIRSQEIPENEYTRIWSGSQERWATEAPFGERPLEDLLKDQPTGPLPLEENNPDTGNQEPEPHSRITTDGSPLIGASPPAQRSMVPQPSPGGRRSPAVLDPPDGNWPADALYAIHVSSFATVEKANAKVDELSAAGYESFVIPAEVSGKGIYHRIFVGSYGNLGLAQADCDQLRQSDAFDQDIHVVDRKWALGN
ncbi:MAG: SPOR domain-containing protein [Desulfobacterales bacterium]|jgi:general secretion pathway protein D